MGACRRLINDLERIFELLSDGGEDDEALLVEGEYCIKEYAESDGKLCLCVLYTLSCASYDDGRSREVESLKRTVVHTCKMCMSLVGEEYFTGGYEIKILRALDVEVREVVEIIVFESMC